MQLPRETGAQWARGDTRIVAGLFLVALAVFVLLNPGRIDITDGQWRYDVADSLVRHGSLAVTDPGLRGLGLPGRSGQQYSMYGVSGPALGLPFVALADFVAPGNRDLAQFLFAWTSSVCGALGLAAMVFFYRRLGLSLARSLVWSLVLGFATLYLPLATSTFDQVQNALLLLVAFLAGHEAHRARAPWMAAVGAVAFAVLINFRYPYLIFLPALLWISGVNDFKAPISGLLHSRTAQIYVLGALAGMILWASVNVLQFGTVVAAAPTSYRPPMLGNPLRGLAVLTISPGKGIFWYSPAVIFCALGWPRFRSRHRDLADGILIAAVLWIGLAASVSFPGGDWCWGPRYWVVVLPLLFLAAPFVELPNRTHKVAAASVIALSLAIQLMASAVENQRFFFERGLSQYFWYEDDSFYFRHSALLARFQEIGRLQSPVPGQLRLPFRPGPHPNSVTYTIFGPPRGELRNAAEWVNRYQIFQWPRPWPYWSNSIGDPNVRQWRIALLASLSVAGVLGIALLASGASLRPRHIGNSSGGRG